MSARMHLRHGLSEEAAEWIRREAAGRMVPAGQIVTELVEQEMAKDG